MQLAINTTQNVVINFTAASVGDRLIAQILDNLVKASYILMLVFLFVIYLFL